MFANEFDLLDVVLDAEAYPLEKAHKNDAGYDIRTPNKFYMWANSRKNIDTGIHIGIPSGYYAKIESKSGLMTKHGITAMGGVIDSGYTGSIVVALRNETDIGYQFEAGDKIAQIIFHRCESPEINVVDSLPETERGDGGFGSTGR